MWAENYKFNELNFKKLLSIQWQNYFVNWIASFFCGNKILSVNNIPNLSAGNNVLISCEHALYVSYNKVQSNIYKPISGLTHKLITDNIYFSYIITNVYRLFVFILVYFKTNKFNRIFLFKLLTFI